MKLTVSSLLLALPAVLAWGQTGHRLTGSLAQKFLDPRTGFLVRRLLPQNWNGSLSRTATWADEIKSGKLKSAYAWASELHYVDAKNEPPHDCSFDYARDCADGKCVVGAISNFTRQLSCQYPDTRRSEALRFVVHFIGDITQPLHTCEREQGGNTVDVLFDHKKRNLHSIWDTYIVEKRILKEFGNSTAAYLDYLSYQARTTYKHQQAKWTECLNKDRTAWADPLECAIQWATDSEHLNCEAVWKLYDQHVSEDFGNAYFEHSWKVVEQQIIKAGVRMANWLDHYVKDCGRGQLPADK